MKSNALRTALLVVAAIVLLLILWTWLALSWSYSDGERAGYVQKFSNKIFSAASVISSMSSRRFLPSQ